MLNTENTSICCNRCPLGISEEKSQDELLYPKNNLSLSKYYHSTQVYKYLLNTFKQQGTIEDFGVSATKVLLKH